MIKTEDIPHLENSTFSTRVVKDIAQNILSFLKSNCTKEGHTYWLFKGWKQKKKHFHVIGACCSVLFLLPDDVFVSLLNQQRVEVTS